MPWSLVPVYPPQLIWCDLIRFLPFLENLPAIHYVRVRRSSMWIEGGVSLLCHRPIVGPIFLIPSTSMRVLLIRANFYNTAYNVHSQQSVVQRGVLCCSGRTEELDGCVVGQYNLSSWEQSRAEGILTGRNGSYLGEYRVDQHGQGLIWKASSSRMLCPSNLTNHPKCNFISGVLVEKLSFLSVGSAWVVGILNTPFLEFTTADWGSFGSPRRPFSNAPRLEQIAPEMNEK
ncbi:hypothetical protein C8R45DRAFT_930757 [Mycena sanguinolenta]|nr:hypothetical protein C8R45DRAFT_930757 [Mycena sanguinolenta]